MKNLKLKTPRPVFLCAILFLFASAAHAQTLSCDGAAGYGLTGGYPSVAMTSRFDSYCSTSPQDKVFTYGDGLVVTVHSIWTKSVVGGTGECSNYPKQILITFSRPVADFQAGVFGAKTVTDNRGNTINLDPPLDPPNSESSPGRPSREALAFFPGGGITSITISNPFEYPVYYFANVLYAEGCWEMGFSNASWNSESKYNQCNCARPAIERPQTQQVGGHGWSMQAEVSDNEGLVLRNVMLNNRYLAEKISVPYYTLETTAFAKQRGELKPNSSDPNMRSRLVNFYVQPDSEKLVIEATYIIDQISASQSCLHITQRYEFYRSVPGDNCEPTSSLPCARWKPIVKYKFFGQGGDVLKSLTVAQRQHLTIDNNAYNTVGLFRDNDFLGFVLDFLDIFEKKSNPLGVEWDDDIAIRGKDAKQWDNVHQTFRGVVEEPSIRFNTQTYRFGVPGCPECGHTHWRWGSAAGGEGRGQLIKIGPSQDVSFAVVRNKAGEEHPTDYHDLLAYPRDALRTWDPSGRNPLQIYRDSAPEDVVFWQSATGYESSDAFFVYGSFFNPVLPSQQLYSGNNGSAAQLQGDGPVSLAALATTDSAQDALTSVTATNIYVAGPTTVSPFDAALPGPLPPGYSVYNDLSYDVSTESESSGPYTIAFSVGSASDPSLFDNLRVFHVEQDPYDPDKIVWVDRTVLAPDPQAPDFANKMLYSKSNLLGQFVVAALTTPQPGNTAASELAVSGSQSPDPVNAGSTLTYTLNITNNGPQTATGITTADELPPGTILISATSSQGSCKDGDGTIVCRLDSLAAGAIATVTIVVKPVEGTLPYPPQGKAIVNTFHASAAESDSNPANNTITQNGTVLPDQNSAPTVSITSPTSGALFGGPANLTINATASDSNGSIAEVKFYDNGEVIGTGTPTDINQYSITWNNAGFGDHSLIAAAKDNQGRIRTSNPVSVTVNGPATVAITSPVWWAGAFNKPANITITANASLSSGTISHVEFYANSLLVGTGTATGVDQYSVTWNDAGSGDYALTAVATDSSGIKTTSTPVNIKVNDPPVTSLLSPVAGSVFTAPANITLTANASDSDGSIYKVDFYANGSLIGNSFARGVNQFSIAWSNVAAGSYSVTAVATDSLGGTTTTSPVNISVNAPPAISMTSPASGSLFTPPANITLTANASDSDGSISGVDFYANGSLIGAGTSTGANQYSFAWANVGYGSYTLTAKATDNNGAITTTGLIPITVNNPPSVNITAPANGATFAAPASVVINANASDSDGTVSKVEFFRNSIKLGEDATAPYSFTWSSAGAGSYTLTAVVTDNLGVTTVSAPVTILISPSALFVTGSTTLNSSDAAIKTRLQNLGYVVTVKDAKTAVSTDANGKAVVVISSTVAPNNLGTKFRTVVVPVVVWESLSFADMGMTATGTSNAGTATGQTQVKITQPTHALAAGLSGTQTVVTVSSTFGWGKPNANATAVATMVSDTTKAVIFGYNTGAAMPGLAAPARRVGLFMNDVTAASFNSNGWLLFDAAINWATSSAP